MDLSERRQGTSAEAHSRAVVVDAHVDTLANLVEGKGTLARGGEASHIDIPRLREGGVDVQFFAVFVEPEYKPERCLKRALQLLDVFYREIEENARDIALAVSAEEVGAIVGSGRIAALLSVEGGEVLQGELAVLRLLYRLGVRSLCLTWNQRNDIADGVADSRSRGGLSEFGAAVVAEMNRLGMVVDVSHISEQGFWDVLEISPKPVIASHSACRSLCEHPRNLTDEQLRAIARVGGVVGVNFYPRFLATGSATIDDALDHIAHIARVAGIDHVGLGSDFDGIDRTPAGLEDVSRLPALTEGLWRRGYGPHEVEKILGGNFLRVLREVLA